MELPNVKQAMYLVKRANHLVSADTFFNCWMKTDILSKSESKTI